MPEKADWLLNAAKGNIMDYEAAAGSGLDFELRPMDDYKTSETVKKVFSKEDGTFDEEKFEEFYKASEKSFNDYEQMDFDVSVTDLGKVLDTSNTRQFRDYEEKDFMKRPMSISFNAYNPFEATKQLGEKIVREKTAKEIAQQNEAIFNTEKGKWEYGESMDDRSLFGFDTLFHKDSYVYATDKKGQYKVDPWTGKFYIETLGGRDPSGKRFVSAADIITNEGSFINKFDYMDSDDKEKSFTGILLKNATQIGLRVLPATRMLTGAISIGKGLLDFGAETYKQASGLMGSDSEFNTANWIQGKTKMMETGMSEYGESNFWSLESLAGLATDSVYQLTDLTSMAKLPSMIKAMSNPKNWKAIKGQGGLKNIATNMKNFRDVDSLKEMVGAKTFSKYGKTAATLSTTYMAGIQSQEIAELGEKLGLTRAEQALLYAGSIAASTALYRLNPLERWVERGMGIDTDTRIFKEAIRKQMPDIATEVKKIASSEMSKKAKKNAIMALGKSLGDGVKTLWDKVHKGKGYFSAAVSEGVEEASEVGLKVGLQNIYNGLQDLGYTATKDKKFKIDYNQMQQELLQSFVGGAAGGIIFKGMGNAPDVVDAEFNELVQNGYGDKLDTMIKSMQRNGEFGSKKLSMALSDSSTEDGDFIYKAVNKNSADPLEQVSQNDFIAKALRTQLGTTQALNQFYKANKDSVDETLRNYGDSFGNLFNPEHHTTIQKDIQDTANKIKEKRDEERDLLNLLSQEGISEEESNEIRADLENVRNEISGLAENLKDIQTGIKTDQYFEQGMYSLRPDITNAFGVKTLGNFIHEQMQASGTARYQDLTEDQKAKALQQYQEYMASGKKAEDLKNAITEIKKFKEDYDLDALVSKINGDKEIARDLSFNRELSNLDLDDTSIENQQRLRDFVDANPEAKVDQSVLAKTQINKDIKDYEEKINDFIGSISKNNLVQESLFSEYSPLIEDFVTRPSASNPTEIEINVDDYIEEMQDFLDNEEGPRIDEIVAKHGSKEAYIEKLRTQMEEVVEKSKDINENVVYPLRDIVSSENYKILNELGKRDKTDVLNTTFREISKLVEGEDVTLYDDFIETQYQRAREEGSNYVDKSNEVKETLEKIIHDIDKKLRVLEAMNTINPAINRFRKENPQFVKGKEITPLPVLDKETYDKIKEELNIRKEQAIDLYNTLLENEANLIQNLRIQEFKHFKQQAKILKDFFEEGEMEIEFSSIENYDTNKTLTVEEATNVTKNYIAIVKAFKEKYDNEENVKERIDNAIGQYDFTQGLEIDKTTISYNTNANAAYLSALVRIDDIEDFYRSLYEFMGDKPAPMYFQELAMLQTYAFVKKGSAGYVQSLDYQNDQSLTDYERVLLKDAISINGDPGAGKTSMVAAFVSFLARKGERGISYYAPAETQVNGLKRSLGEAEHIKEGGTLNRLIEDLGGTPIDNLSETHKENGKEFTINDKKILTHELEFSKIDTTSKYEAGEYPFESKEEGVPDTSIILIDEGSFNSKAEWYQLNELVRDYKRKTGKPLQIVTLYDSNQNGVSSKIKSSDGELTEIGYNMGQIVTEFTPKLNFSLRGEFQSIQGYLDPVQKGLGAGNQADIAEFFQKEENHIPNNYFKGSFEGVDNDFVGIARKTDTEFEQEARAIYEAHKARPDSTFAFITNDVSKAQALFGTTDITILTPKDVQGQEFDYVVMDAIYEPEGQLRTKRMLEFLNTMISRARKGMVYNDHYSTQYPEIVFAESKQIEKPVKILRTGSTPEQTEQFYKGIKDFKMQVISNVVNIDDLQEGDGGQDTEDGGTQEGTSEGTQDTDDDGDTQQDPDEDPDQDTEEEDGEKNEYNKVSSILTNGGLRVFSFYTAQRDVDNLKDFIDPIVVANDLDTPEKIAKYLDRIKLSLMFNNQNIRNLPGMAGVQDIKIELVARTAKGEEDYRNEGIHIKENGLDAFANNDTMTTPEGDKVKNKVVHMAYELTAYKKDGSRFTITLFALPNIYDFRKKGEVPGRETAGTGTGIYEKDPDGWKRLDAIYTKARQAVIDNNNERVVLKTLDKKGREDLLSDNSPKGKKIPLGKKDGKTVKISFEEFLKGNAANVSIPIIYTGAPGQKNLSEIVKGRKNGTPIALYTFDPTLPPLDTEAAVKKALADYMKDPEASPYDVIAFDTAAFTLGEYVDRYNHFAKMASDKKMKFQNVIEATASLPVRVRLAAMFLKLKLEIKNKRDQIEIEKSKDKNYKGELSEVEAFLDSRLNYLIFGKEAGLDKSYILDADGNLDVKGKLGMINGQDPIYLAMKNDPKIYDSKKKVFIRKGVNEKTQISGIMNTFNTKEVSEKGGSIKMEDVLKYIEQSDAYKAHFKKGIFTGFTPNFNSMVSGLDKGLQQQFAGIMHSELEINIRIGPPETRMDIEDLADFDIQTPAPKPEQPSQQAQNPENLKKSSDDAAKGKGKETTKKQKPEQKKEPEVPASPVQAISENPDQDGFVSSDWGTEYATTPIKFDGKTLFTEETLTAAPNVGDNMYIIRIDPDNPNKAVAYPNPQMSDKIYRKFSNSPETYVTSLITRKSFSVKADYFRTYKAVRLEKNKEGDWVVKEKGEMGFFDTEKERDSFDPYNKSKKVENLNRFDDKKFFDRFDNPRMFKSKLTKILKGDTKTQDLVQQVIKQDKSQQISEAMLEQLILDSVVTFYKDKNGNLMQNVVDFYNGEITQTPVSTSMSLVPAVEEYLKDNNIPFTNVYSETDPKGNTVIYSSNSNDTTNPEYSFVIDVDKEGELLVKEQPVMQTSEDSLISQSNAILDGTNYPDAMKSKMKKTFEDFIKGNISDTAPKQFIELLKKQNRPEVAKNLEKIIKCKNS